MIKQNLAYRGLLHMCLEIYILPNKNSGFLYSPTKLEFKGLRLMTYRGSYKQLYFLNIEILKHMGFPATH